MIKPVLQKLAHPLLLKLPLANKLALIVASLSFLSCLLVTLASQQQLSSISHNNLNLLGGELSEQLALNARPALIQGNTLSLQAMLEELSQSEIILHTAIFNVENKPIAEAGQRAEGKAYMAPIHFQDTIAGHSLVVLNPQHLATQTTGLLLQQLLLSLLFAGCCYALTLWLSGKFTALLKQLKQYIASPNYPVNTRRIKSPYPAEDELQSFIQQLLKGPNLESNNSANAGAALLHINWQTSNSPSKLQLQHLKQQLSTVCKLYKGKLQLTRPNSFSAIFYESKEASDHPFRALCCAKIISQLLAEEETINFQLKVLLSDEACEFSLQSLIQKAEQWQTDEKLCITSEVTQHSSVSDKLELEEEITLSHSYSELITRQLSALRLQFQRQAE